MKNPKKLFEERRGDGDYCRLEDMSPTFVKLMVTSEDVPFYRHHGFNPEMIKRSLIANLKRHKTLFGGSTITQQLAKNLYFTFEKSYFRKFRECFVTLYLERHFTKDQILEFYLNLIYYGNGQYGITGAARFYYSETPAELDFLQSLNLITVVTGPTYLNPLTHPDHFVTQRDKRLEHLKIMGLVDDAYIARVKEAYPAERVHELFRLSGEPLLDPKVPMKNALAEELRSRKKQQ